MRESLLKALAPREESMTIAGTAVIVRELKEDGESLQFALEDDALFHYIVRCTFYADSGEPCFTVADIPELKVASKLKLRMLASTVMQVNGLDVGAEVKNSEAGPVSGSSSISQSRPAESMLPIRRLWSAIYDRLSGGSIRHST